MAFGTGLDGQAGIGTEAAYGTFLAPTKFFDFESISVEPDEKSIVYQPVNRGLVARSGFHREKVIGGTGQLVGALMNKGSLRLLKHACGVAVDAQVGATAEYSHTFTPDIVSGMRGLSATVQAGIPQTDGTVQPFTGVGGKVTGWELSLSRQDWLKLTTTWDFKDVVTNQALASASYASGAQPFSELDLVLTIGGAAVATLEQFSLKADHKLKVDRFAAGGVKNEPLANGLWAFTGSFQGSEFDSMTAFNHFLAGDEIATVVATVTGATIPTTANPYKVTITIPIIKYTGTAPKVSGPDVVTQDRPFDVLYDGTNAPYTIVVNNDETAS